MIQFENWTISALCGEVIARQYDNLSRTLTVMGDLPAGWDWSMLVESGGNLNIISLSPVDGGVGVTLTADMIPYAGYYRMQLRGTQGEAVRHTNIIQVYIPESLTGEGQWPDLPSEFGQIEERMQELAGQAQDSADAADTSAKAAAESAAAAQGAEESVAANAKAAQDAANAAQTSEGNAKTSETNAAKSAGDAQTSASQAADSATQAKTVQGKAEAAQTAAETAQGKAETAAGTATQAAQGAVTSAGQASQSAQEAASAATAAQNAQGAAEKAQGQAEAQATAAAGSATAAQESAAAAAGSSSSASGSAQTAQTAAQNAQKSAETAQEARQGAQAAQQAIEDLEVSSETLEPDSPASVEKTVSPEGVVTLEFGIPMGPQGPSGVDAPQINDAIITDANPWSSRKIVDTLAPEFETSGAVVTCTPVAGYPLHVVSQIMPVQEGEGDPSPDNVRPIRGWDAANLWVAGKNLWDNDYAMNPDNWEYGTYYALRLPLAPNATYTISMSKNNMVKDYNPDYNGQFAFYLGETPYTSIGNKLIGNTAVLDVPLTYTFSTSDKLMYANLYVGSYGYSGFEIAFTELLVNLQIEAGSTPAIYTPYNPASKTITLPFGQTVYGGALDWTTGVLTVTYAEIASYSGESLPGVWISDRDVYSQGATPTTGAQVVYELAQPQTIQLTPQEILALSGTNNIYADTGDVTVSGRADPNAVINNLAQRIAALEGQAING